MLPMNERPHPTPLRRPPNRPACLASWARILVIISALSCAWLPSCARADEQDPAPPDGVKPDVAATRGQAPAFKPPTFADTTVMYVFGPDYRNPYTVTPSEPEGADIRRNAVELKHVDSWRYGHNLVDVAIKKSSDVEPAAGGGTGAVGLYAIFRSGVGLNKLAGRSLIAAGPLRDIAIEAGLNLETKNSDFAPAERTVYLGPQLQFRFGQGFVNLGLHLRKEWNHNGHLGTEENYDLDFNVSPAWRFPFALGRARLAFEGFADYNTAKGRDAAGRDTRPELITRPQLKLDVGHLLGQGARVLEVGVGFQYWHNMFGKNANRVPGAKELTPVASLTVHLPLGAAAH